MSDARERKLADLEAGNKRREDQLHDRGLGMAAGTGMGCRLEAIERLLAEEFDDAAIRLRILYQEVLREALEIAEGQADDVEAEARRQALTQGLRSVGKSPLVDPGKP